MYNVKSSLITGLLSWSLRYYLKLLLKAKSSQCENILPVRKTNMFKGFRKICNKILRINFIVVKIICSSFL